MTGKFVLLIVVVMFTFTGCALVGASKLIENEVIPGRVSILPTPDLVTADVDPQQVAEAAYKKLCEVKSYRTRTELTGPTGASIVTTAEFVAPDRRRAVQFAGTSAEFETITIGSRTYARDNNKWTEMKGLLSNAYADPLMMCSQDAKTVKLPDMPELPTPKLTLIGPGEVNGVKVLVYKSTVEMKGLEIDAKSESTVSFGARDGMLYKTQSKSIDPEMGDVTSTTIYSDYDADIRIECPI